MAKRKTRRRKRYKKRTSKSISLGNGFRLNLSKSGINLSGGVKGARVSIGNKGIKSNLSIPGTGISKTKTLVSTKDFFDKVKDDKKTNIKSTNSKKVNRKTERVNKEVLLKDEAPEVILNKEELEALKKRDAAARRVDSIESQFKTGNYKNQSEEKVLDKDVPKSFMKESFKTGWWISLIVIGILTLIFNKVLGAGIIIAGVILILLEYQLPKKRAKRYFNTGIDLYKEKKYEEAIKEMEKAILFNTDHEYMNLTMGTIKYEIFDDTKGAIIHLTKVMELYQNKEAIFLLGKCYFTLEEYTKTIELLQKISLRKNKEREKVLLVARSYLLTNYPKLAIEVLLPIANEYVINRDELIEVNYWLGYAYLDDFNLELAWNYLRLVYDQDSEYRGIGRLIENIEI